MGRKILVGLVVGLMSMVLLFSAGKVLANGTTGSISGTVYDENDAPLAGKWVYAEEYDGGEGKGANTDESGNYTIADLEHGAYRVQIRDDEDDYVNEYYNGTYNWDDAAPVNIVAGQDTPNIDFSLEIGGSISGKVGDADSELGGVRVMVFSQTAHTHFGDSLSGEDGSYTVKGIPADVCYLVYKKNGYGTHVEFDVPVTVPDETQKDDVVLSGNPGSISGTITELDPGEKPLELEGIRVEVLVGKDPTYTEDEPAYWIDCETWTDEMGRYTIPDMEQRSAYKVCVWKPTDGNGVRYAEPESRENVPVFAGTLTDGQDFQMPKSVKIYGRITPAVANINVEGEGEDEFIKIQFGVDGEDHEHTRTDGDGDYELNHLWPNIYYTVEARGITDNGTDYAAQTKGPFMLVEAGQSLEVNFDLLPNAGQIKGRIVQAEDYDGNGQIDGLPGVEIYAEIYDEMGREVSIPWRERFADANGYFYLPHIPPGQYIHLEIDNENTLMVDGIRYGEAETAYITVNPGLETDIGIIALKQAGSISGHVYEMDGVTPIPNMDVYGEFINEDGVETGLGSDQDSDAFGLFQVDYCPPGDEWCVTLEGDYSFDEEAGIRYVREQVGPIEVVEGENTDIGDVKLAKQKVFKVTGNIARIGTGELNISPIRNDDGTAEFQYSWIDDCDKYFDIMAVYPGTQFEDKDLLPGGNPEGKIAGWGDIACCDYILGENIISGGDYRLITQDGVIDLYPCWNHGYGEGESGYMLFYPKKTMTVSEQEGEIQGPDFVLPTNWGRLTGTISTEDGGIRDFRSVFIWVQGAPQDIAVAACTPFPGGEYNIHRILPPEEYGINTYTVKVISKGYATCTETIDIEAGETTVLNIVLKKGGEIRGTVTEKDSGEPIQGAKINAGGKETYTDANGLYFLNIAPGTYDVTAGKSGYAGKKATEVKVVNKQTTAMPFELESKVGSIKGKVTDTGEVKLPNAEVVAYNTDDNTQANAFTDPDGNYTIENLTYGNYKIAAWKSGYDVRQIGGLTIDEDNENLDGIDFTGEDNALPPRGPILSFQTIGQEDGITAITIRTDKKLDSDLILGNGADPNTIAENGAGTLSNVVKVNDHEYTTAYTPDASEEAGSEVILTAAGEVNGIDRLYTYRFINFPDYTAESQSNITPAEGGTTEQLSNDDCTYVEVPPYAILNDDNGDLTAVPLVIKRYESAEENAVTDIYDFDFAGGTDAEVNPDHYITIYMQFDPTLWDGDINSIQILYKNEAGEWVDDGIRNISVVGNAIKFDVNHLTQFKGVIAAGGGNGGGGGGGGGSSSGGGGSGDNCFIATACYGTPMAEDVITLRRFRDECLLTNAPGRLFVKTYYRTSPPIADFIAKHSVLKSTVRVCLKPLVWMSRTVNTQ